MTPLALGLRLVLRGSRATRVRFLLMTLGCALGVACLAAALSIPAILAAHDGRAAGREVQGGPGSGALFLERKDPFGNRPLTRIFISPPETGTVPRPPGVARVPQPGEVVVSPALGDLLAERPGLKGALPGRVVDTIGPAGLTGPQELYAYVGRTRAQLPPDEARPLGGYGNRWTAPDEAAIDDGTVAPLRFTLCCLVLLPLFVYLSVCVRLSAEARSRRLASLRLLGLSARDTMRVSAVETLCAAAVGAALGVGLHLLVNASVARTGWVGLAWYPADGLPSVWTLAACLLGCPTLAYLAGRRHAKEAAVRPLAVRRQAQPGKPRRWLAALLVLPGLGIVTAYCVLGVLGVHVEPSAVTSFLVPAGALLTGAGLVLALPPVTAWLAARVAATTQRLPLTLAMRHHETTPGAALRVVSGLVLLVYAASLTQGVLVELDQVSRRTAPNQEYEVPLRQVTPEQRTAMVKTEGISGNAVAAEVPSREGDILFATCAELEKLAMPGTVRGCVEGRPLALHDPFAHTEDTKQPGTTHLVKLRDEAGQEAGSARFTVPEETVTFAAVQPSALSSALLLVPPKSLPPGVHPGHARLVLSGAPEPEAVQATLDRLAGIAPTAQIDPVGIVIESLRQLSVVKGLLGTGMVLGLVIGVAAFLVSATDRAMDGRRRTATLTLLGIRTRTLRAAQCAQVLLPLAVGIGGALVAGRLAESSYLVTGGGAVFWDGEGLPLLLLSGLGVLAVAGLASLPMARRHLDPELLRRD
ncbi:FtsX-like permease family protein [Streptomyces sp. FR-008]|uniref:FtsX-like permease family protein n=1 Tax=Streptomyces sp. FR-008 TaxID=206662 RepID=UPI00096B251C|nr:FtsX-like permease family protein [Streptomyces sp. FR-008]KAF0793644.1 ABC transporter permease [Streptomyces sp. FR-008]